uniref:Uncharacterized protein n=1 Tax=Glossina palpalis gambiensis TaxID=67801 RepID=A0A1B0C071_9MUSC
MKSHHDIQGWQCDSVIGFYFHYASEEVVSLYFIIPLLSYRMRKRIWLPTRCLLSDHLEPFTNDDDSNNNNNNNVAVAQLAMSSIMSKPRNILMLMLSSAFDPLFNWIRNNII